MKPNRPKQSQPGQVPAPGLADQPGLAQARGQCIFTLLTPAGVPGGKVSARHYLPAFCNHLRSEGYRTDFCTSIPEIERLLNSGLPAIVVHLFGEDRFQILQPGLEWIEDRAIATYNSAMIGPVLADKIKTQERLAAAGIRMPEIDPESGVGFQRQIFGSSEPSEVIDASATGKAAQSPADTILTRFVDTRLKHRGITYFTTIRLMCIDDVVLHAFPRARDASEGNPNVHTRDTPLDPSLIEALNDRLVVPFQSVFADIARAAHSALGHGFFSHDLLVERTSGDVFLCESGFKFDDTLYTDHLAPIRSMLPSQTPLFLTEAFARASAQVFAARCSELIRGTA